MLKLPLRTVYCQPVCFLSLLTRINLMNFFCGMVDWRKAFSLTFSRDHSQRFSTSWISDTPRAGFEPAPNLSSGSVKWSFSVVTTTSPRHDQVKSGPDLKKQTFNITYYLVFKNVRSILQEWYILLTPD